jgi:hypothetical protein
LSCDRYYVIKTKSTRTREKSSTYNHFLISNEVIIEIIYWIITFYSLLVHCLMFEKFVNFFKLVNFEIFRKRAFNRSRSKKLDKVIASSFRLRAVDISFFNNNLIQINKYMIISLNSWWRMFIIIVSWILIKECSQPKFIISWIHCSSILIVWFWFWRWI